jgi:GNAT superfamily N-acetyltransferase
MVFRYIPACSMITASIESFAAALPELQYLFPIHHRELALFQDRMPLAPQYGEYIARERAGRLLLATVRKSGSIIAYYVAQVAPGFHYGETLTAHMDIMYVVPEERHKGYAVPLLHVVKRELQRRGVQLWFGGSKIGSPLHGSMDRLHKALGFVPTDLYYARWLGPPLIEPRGTDTMDAVREIHAVR